MCRKKKIHFILFFFYFKSFSFLTLISHRTFTFMLFWVSLFSCSHTNLFYVSFLFSCAWNEQNTEKKIPQKFCALFTLHFLFDKTLIKKFFYFILSSAKGRIFSVPWYCFVDLYGIVGCCNLWLMTVANIPHCMLLCTFYVHHECHCYLWGWKAENATEPNGD